LTEKLEKFAIIEFVLFVIGIILISFFYNNNLLLTSLLIISLLIITKIWHQKDDIYFFLVAAILGPVSEIIMIHFGVWQYTNPTAFGIPLWLPLAWGLSAIIIKRFAYAAIKLRK